MELRGKTALAGAVGTALALGVPAAAEAALITIDFSSIFTVANGVTSLTDPSWGGLTITARTQIIESGKGGKGGGNGTDPIYGGVDGMVFGGNLGVMDDPTDCTPGCFGLGVKPGSAGISGDGPQQDESLVFTWATGIDVDSISITLVGINPNTYDKEGKSKGDGDVVYLAFDFLPLGSTSDQTIASVAVPFSAPSTITFSGLSGLTGTVGSVAVYASVGHFGVSGMSFSTPSAVPEPFSISLVGLGLVGIAAARWRSAKKTSTMDRIRRR